MIEDSTLYAHVLRRVSEAREKVDALSVSDDVRRVLLARLTRFRRWASYDLTRVSRRVEGLHADLDAGEIPLYDE